MLVAWQVCVNAGLGQYEIHVRTSPVARMQMRAAVFISSAQKVIDNQGYIAVDLDEIRASTAPILFRGAEPPDRAEGNREVITNAWRSAVLPRNRH